MFFLKVFRQHYEILMVDYFKHNFCINYLRKRGTLSSSPDLFKSIPSISLSPTGQTADLPLKVLAEFV